MLRESTKPGAGSRRIFAPHFKLQVLDSYRNDSDCKGNQRATARKYGIHRRQIQKWLQAENSLRNTVGKSAPHQVVIQEREQHVVAVPNVIQAPPPPLSPSPIDLTVRKRVRSPTAWDLTVKRPKKLFKPYLDDEEAALNKEKSLLSSPQQPTCCCPYCDGCYNNDVSDVYHPRPLYVFPSYYGHTPEYSIDLKLVDCYYREAGIVESVGRHATHAVR